MARLTETDHRELINYIIEKLRALQADDVIRQIRDLEKVNVLEKAGPLSADEPEALAAKNTMGNFPGQMKRDRFKTSIEVWSEEEISKTPDKKLVKEAVSEYRLRPMTPREMCRAAIDILESYLITIPSIVETTKKALELGPDEHIFWITENARGDEADHKDIERSTRRAASENREEMEALIAALRADL